MELIPTVWSASNIVEWALTFNEMTKNKTDEGIYLTALGFEQTISNNISPYNMILFNSFIYPEDNNFILKYKNNKNYYKEPLNRLIFVLNKLESGFPLLGSLIESYIKILEEVSLVGSVR